MSTRRKRFLTLKEVERRHIMKVLEATGFHKAETAAILDVSAKTIYNKINQYRDEGHLK